MSHLIKIYAVCKFSYFGSLELRQTAHNCQFYSEKPTFVSSILPSLIMKLFQLRTYPKHHSTRSSLIRVYAICRGISVPKFRVSVVCYRGNLTKDKYSRNRTVACIKPSSINKTNNLGSYYMKQLPKYYGYPI